VRYVVVEGAVGNQLRYEGLASWPTATLGWAVRDGIVTSVDLPGDGMVVEGGRLLSVGLRPVVAVKGKVPASRELSRGSSGADVKQLQSFLVRAGYSSPKTGKFDWATSRAVAAWQKKAGFIADGVVRLGDVVFFAKLPTRIALSEQVVVGASVAAGAPLVEGVVGDAVVEVVASAEQVAMIPLDADVTASLGEDSWPGRFGQAWTDAEERVHLPVLAAGGGPVCGSDCARVFRLGKALAVRLDVVEVPQTSGPVVPVSALRTEVSGQVSVVGADGTVIPVRVVAAYGGLAVVDGVGVGTSIEVFAP
jgi:hypothetical protein